MSNYIITPLLTKKLQKKSLDMVCYFDRFCQENGLTYYLCGGCCIGAIRNGGFIPWDDDVDVFMPRNDYERLKQLWTDTEQYRVQYPSETLCTENQFLTISDENTTFIKSYQKDLDICHGVMLDVIPLDGCPNGYRRISQKFWAILYSLFVIGKPPENHGKVIRTVGRALLKFAPSYAIKYKIWHYCEKKMSQYPIEQCDYVTELCSGIGYMQNEYPSNCFKKPLRVKFEEQLLNIPTDYNTYLSIAFGNYMQLPPENERVCHHEWEFIDLDRSYRHYRGTRYLISDQTNK